MSLLVLLLALLILAGAAMALVFYLRQPTNAINQAVVSNALDDAMGLNGPAPTAANTPLPTTVQVSEPTPQSMSQLAMMANPNDPVLVPLVADEGSGS